MNDYPERIITNSVSYLEDIKLLIEDVAGKYAPVYAADAIESNLSLASLLTNKTSTFPWNSSLTIKQPLANKMYLEDDFEVAEETSDDVSNVNNSDLDSNDDYEEDTSV